MLESPKPLSYAEHLPAIYRLAFLMTGGHVAASEVLQHTVEEAEREELGGVRKPWPVRRWLFTCALTACRRTRARPVPADASVPGDAWMASPPEGLAASVAADECPATDERRDAALQLARLFGELPEDERAAAALFYLYLCTPAEMAEILEVKQDELGLLLFNGRERLQRQKAACEDLSAAA